MRGRVVIAGVALLCAGAGAAATDAHRAILAQPTLTPVPLQPPYTLNLPFREPPTIRSSKGRLKLTMVARNGDIDVSGIKISDTQTYGVGNLPRGLLGPTLQVQPGDEIDITLDNQLTQLGKIGATNASHDMPCMDDTSIPVGAPQPTNLHFHGLHVSPLNHKINGVTYYGDNVFACMLKGRHHIRFRIPANHDLGTFWYHAHMHGLTDDQVYRGLAGMLLIGDSRTQLPARFAKVPTRLISLKDIQAIPVGDHWSIPTNHDWANPTTRTINGLVMPTITLRPGQTELWRLANSSSAVWYNVALGGVPLTIVSRDGNRLIAPQTTTEPLLLGPGQRLDVLVSAPKTQAALKLKTMPFDQGRVIEPGKPTFLEADLATVNVAGAAATPIAAPQPSGKLPTFPSKRGPTRTWRFNFNGKGYINGKQFDPEVPGAKPRLGTTERWILINDSSEWHPIHIHQDDFRVISVNGSKVTSIRSDQDIVPLPPKTNGKPGRVVIDFPFQQYYGNFVMHCHILDHEDAGMMTRIEVLK